MRMAENTSGTFCLGIAMVSLLRSSARPKVIGPKTGSNRAKEYSKNKMFPSVFNIILGFLGVLIIPKWLINDS